MDHRTKCCVFLFVLVLHISIQCSAQEKSSPALPAWLESINPADYMLLAPDLNDPFAIEEEISASAEAAVLNLATEGGNGTKETYSFRAEEKVKVKGDMCPAHITIIVKVYEDSATAASLNHISNYTSNDPNKYWWDPSYFSDPRLAGGVGESNSRFRQVEWLTFVDGNGVYKEGKGLEEITVRYKNIVASFYPGMFYTGMVPEWAGFDICGATKELAHLWLDKVSRIRPQQVNLRMSNEIVFGYPYLTASALDYKPLMETSADQQAIQAGVFNDGADVAKDVHIQFYLQKPGEVEPTALGEPILVGDVPPGKEGRTAHTYWNIGGENVEGAVLSAKAYVPGAVDVDPSDNSVSAKVNIYYAQSNGIPYSHFDDAYSFKNYDFNESDTEEMAERLIAIAAMGNPNSVENDIWIRLFFPMTYTRLWDYFKESYLLGSGGHCYGMAATSALYFKDPSLKPVEKKTSEMSREEANLNINLYHRAQMLPIFRSLISGDIYFNRGFGKSSTESQMRTYEVVKRYLKENREPVIISFRGRRGNGTWGHAVLAYKLVEIEGNDKKIVYIYDSNAPISEVESSGKPMPAVILYTDGFLYYGVVSGGNDYTTRIPNIIAANPVFRTVPLEDAKTLLPELRRMVKGWIETLRKNGGFAAVARCPADLLFIDAAGRKVGTLNGMVINEIPGAEVLSSGEVEMYVLPVNSTYHLEIKGTGSGEVDLDIIKPNGEAVDLVSFQKVPVDTGTKLEGTLESGSKIEALEAASSRIAPALVGSIDLSSIELPPSTDSMEKPRSEVDNMTEDLDPVEKAIRDLQDPDVEVRRRATATLFELNDTRAVEPLVRALSDEDADVREGAAAALEKLGAYKDGGTASGDENMKPGMSDWSGHASWIISAARIGDLNAVYVDPSGTKIAYKQTVEGGQRYIIAWYNGRINESIYDLVDGFVFSPDGMHYGYKARRGSSIMAVIDGSESEEYYDIGRIIFSQDGERYAYVARKDDKSVVVVDGHEEGPYDRVADDPIFSSDGKHLAYTISRDTANYVVLDGEIQEYRGWDPVFSPDGSRFAYKRTAVYAGDPCYIVLDGEILNLGDNNGVGQMVFSPDGRRFAYDFLPNFRAYSDHIVVVDGVRGNAYPFPGVGKIVFSPDSSRFAYAAKSREDGYVMVVDGSEGNKYDEISDPIFSPDSRHIAYTAKDKDGKFVVLDGKEGPRHYDVWGLNFSREGRLAYVARDSMYGYQDVRRAVVDGQEGPLFHYNWYGQGIRAGPIFSPGGGHFVYVANDGGKAEFMVLDGVRHIHPWTFVWDSGQDKASPIVFDSEEDFHYLAANDTGIYLVHARVQPEPADADACSWHGIWDTTLGVMELNVLRDTVVGLIQNPYWLGRVDGRIEGETLSGTIARPPNYAPPNVDSFQMNMSHDCRNITIRSRNGMEGPWTSEGSGTRI